MKQRKLYAAVVAAIAPFSSMVFAADAAPMIEEVLVTAQKREQTLKDVPSSVAALSESYLAKTGTKNFSDIGKIASGIEIGGASDGFGRNVRIRGVGTNKYVSAVSPSVGVFIDDVPLVDAAVAFTNLLGVERIEVLKGPQSTLFGKGVSSGAISIVTKAPDTETNEGYIEANIGSRGLQEYRLGGNLALGDQFAVRGGFYSAAQDGEIKNTVSGKDGIESDNSGGRVRLMWKPSDSFDAILGYQKHRMESIGTDYVINSYGDYIQLLADSSSISLIEGHPFDRKTQDSSAMVRDTDTEISSLHINWKINDNWTFASVTSDQKFFQGNTDSKLRTDDSADTTVGPFVVTPFITQNNIESFSQEFRFNYDSDNLLSTIGVFYSDTEGQTETPLGNTVAAIPIPGNPLLLRLAILSLFDQETEEWAVFSNSVYSFSDRWDVTFGLRYNEVNKRDHSATFLGQGLYAPLQSPLIPIVSNWAIPKQETDWKVFTGALKFTYDFSDDLTLYFGYDRGFKAGGHDTVSHDVTDPTGNSFSLNPAFDEEYGDNYEIGLKGMFLDRSLSWNGSIFHQIYSDYQVNVPDPITTFKIINAAEVIVEGAEMDFQWLVNQNLSFDGNLSYINSRYDSYKNAGCNAPQFKAVACGLGADGNSIQDLSNKRLNLVSPWTANFNGTWEDSLSNGMTWYVRTELAFRDDRIGTPDLDPATSMPSYMLVNASVGLKSADDTWSTLLWAKNLADKDYYTSIEGNNDGAAVVGYRATLGASRSYGVTLKYNF